MKLFFMRSLAVFFFMFVANIAVAERDLSRQDDSNVVTEIRQSADSVFSFNYVQFDFISGSINVTDLSEDVEGSGIRLAVSLGFAPNYTMTLAVSSVTLPKFQNIRVDDSKVTSLGVTAHTDILSQTAVFANLALVKAEVNLNPSTTDTGYGGALTAGVRQRLSKRLELELDAEYMSVLDEELTSITLQSRYYFRNKLSIGFGYTGNKSIDSLFINLRVNV